MSGVVEGAPPAPPSAGENSGGRNIRLVLNWTFTVASNQIAMIPAVISLNRWSDAVVLDELVYDDPQLELWPIVTLCRFSRLLCRWCHSQLPWHQHCHHSNGDGVLQHLPWFHSITDGFATSRKSKRSPTPRKIVLEHYPVVPMVWSICVSPTNPTRDVVYSPSVAGTFASKVNVFVSHLQEQ